MIHHKKKIKDSIILLKGLYEVYGKNVLITGAMVELEQRLLRF